MFIKSCENSFDQIMQKSLLKSCKNFVLLNLAKILFFFKSCKNFVLLNLAKIPFFFKSCKNFVLSILWKFVNQILPNLFNQILQKFRFVKPFVKMIPISELFWNISLYFFFNFQERRRQLEEEERTAQHRQARNLCLL